MERNEERVMKEVRNATDRREKKKDGMRGRRREIKTWELRREWMSHTEVKKEERNEGEK